MYSLVLCIFSLHIYNPQASNMSVSYRFLIPSTRNRHMARAHGQYGRRYYDEAEDASSQEELDSGTYLDIFSQLLLIFLLIVKKYDFFVF